MSNTTAIETAFVTKVQAIEGLSDALAYEPQTLPRYLPVVTLLFIGAPETDFATGIVEVIYHWRVSLYIALNDYKRAQDQLKELLPQLLAITRLDPRLDESCTWAEVSDEDEEPVFAENDQWLVKTLHLRAQTEEPIG